MGAPASIYELAVSWITMESRSCSTSVTSCHGCKDLTIGHYGCHAWMLRTRFDMVLSFGKYFLYHGGPIRGRSWDCHINNSPPPPRMYNPGILANGSIRRQSQYKYKMYSARTRQRINLHHPGSGIVPPSLFRRKAPPLATRPGATSRLERYDTISTCRCRAGNAPALVDPSY